MRFLVIIALILSYSLSLAQTGPGGVGNNTGSSSLIGWYSTEFGAERVSGVSAGVGDSVSIWLDRSGTGNDLIVPASFLAPEIINFLGFDCVYFDSDVYRGLYDTLSGSGFSELTLISVLAQPVVSGRCRQAGIGNKLLDATADNFQQGGTNRIFKDNGNFVQTIPGSANTILIRSSQMDATSVEDWVLGSQNISGGTPFTTGNGIFHVGDKSTIDEISYLYETMFFNSRIDTAERIIIENYLAAKYGLSLGDNDLYEQDDPGNGDFDNDVAGIGRLNAANELTDSRGTGRVRFLNADDLDDDEFFIWGHDGGDFEATSTTDLPTGVEKKFDRIWRISEVNSSGSAVNVGRVDIRFDLSATLPVDAADLALIIDSDNNGVFANNSAVTGATDLGGGIFEFTQVPGNLFINSRRFTLGTLDSIATPLPVQNTNMRIEVMREAINIFVLPIIDTNVISIELERTSNGSEWEALHTFQFEKHRPRQLSFLDKSPIDGRSYYRLIHTYSDGSKNYTKALRVDFNPESKSIIAYPNPCQDILQITSVEAGPIRVFNHIGDDITNEVEVELNTESKTAVLGLKKLSPGLYFVKNSRSMIRIHKE